MAQVNRREQVKSLIETGNYTKQEIADELGVPVASVSSQMTYLRWMKNFIQADENKKLRFVSEEEDTAAREAALANRKVKSVASKLTPQDQANAIAKALKSQEASMVKLTAKKALVTEDLAEEPNNEDLMDIANEVDANITILSLKIKRNKAKAATLPEPNLIDAPVEDNDVPTDEDEDLL